jgi:N-acetylglucosamine transport system substrate-binding protein
MEAPHVGAFFIATDPGGNSRKSIASGLHGTQTSAHMRTTWKGLGCSVTLFLWMLLTAGKPISAAEPVVLEVACFQGGYGIDFFEKCAREYEAAHPDVKVRIQGNPRIWEQLVPRFASGKVPDLCWPGWGMNTWELIFGNRLKPLDKYLEQPAHGTNLKWIDTFVPSLLNKGRYQGHYYLLPYNFDAFGLWYNKKLFKRHGWEPPRTFDELEVLCERIRKEHIAPLTFTGRYPDYLMRGCFYPWVISEGGMKAFHAAQNLEPGAWKHPAFLKAAESIVKLKKKGYFQTGCIGMSHTESQMEFLVGRAAMIPCGTWLHSEMKNMLPAGFEMEFMPCPPYRDGKGDSNVLYAGIDGKGWCIPADAAHPDLAADFFRFVSSPAKAKEFIETKGTLMSIKVEGEINAPPHLKEPLRLVKGAASTWYTDSYDWYPTLPPAHTDAIRDLFNGVLSPAEFVDSLESVSGTIRNDPEIRKFQVQP